MKNLIIIFAIVFSTAAAAQIRPAYPIVLNAGNSGYVTIGGQDYPRNAIGFYYSYSDSFTTESATYDSTLSIYWTRDGLALYSHVVDTMFVYGDSTNKQVRNMSVLRTWLRTNAYYRGN